MHLIQCFSEPQKSQHRQYDGKETERQHRRAHRFQIRPLEHDATYKPQEVGQRKDLTQYLRPMRHTFIREHEAGQQQGRQEEKETHLHSLHLAARNR